MKYVTANTAAKDFYELLIHVTENFDPVTIVSDSNTDNNVAVLISNYEWENINDKIHLLSLPGMQWSIQNFIKESFPEKVKPKSIASEFQEMLRLRTKASHDEAQALNNAAHKTSLKIAKNLLDTGIPINKIATATGLTQKEIERL